MLQYTLVAAAIAVETVSAFPAASKVPEEVVFVCFDRENYDLYGRLLNLTP